MLYCSKHDFFSLFSFFYRKKIWFSSGSYYISYKEHAELFFSLKMSQIFVTALPMLPGFSGPPGLGVVATAAVLSGGRQQGGGGGLKRRTKSGCSFPQGTSGNRNPVPLVYLALHGPSTVLLNGYCNLSERVVPLKKPNWQIILVSQTSVSASDIWVHLSSPLDSISILCERCN